jgi:sulfur carrier protein ThiS
MDSSSRVRLLACALLLGLAACGGSGDAPTPPPASPPPPPPPPPPPAGANPQYLVSAASPFAAGCDHEDIGGTLYVGAEVEPWLSVDPRDPGRMVGVWQQDRWSNGSSRGVMAGLSTDGGRHWTRRPLPFTRCAGGNAGNGGDYARASNPWVSHAPDGSVHAVAIAGFGVLFQPGSANAVLATRSLDGGNTWSAPATLIRDGSGFFNDKVAVVADRVDPGFVYTVWDRLVAGDNGGPTYLARSTDDGATWEPARPIHDPGPHSQTISNVPVVLPDGAVLVMFVQIDYGGAAGGGDSARIEVVRSDDKGMAWGTPVVVADLLSVGTRDPGNGTPVRDASIIPQVAVAPNGDVYVAWQDARFSNGARDAIVIARSVDGGATWSAPARVNAVASVAAFDPTVHVRDDGTVGVGYYDFRSDTVAAPLLTDTWLARSSDGGAHWTESRVAEPFDLSIAPRTTSPGNGGYFLGDYQGLSSRGGVFLPLYAKGHAGNVADRTGIYSAPAEAAVAASMRVVAKHAAPRAGPLPYRPTPWMRVRVDDNLRRARRLRMPLAEAIEPPPAIPSSPDRSRLVAFAGNGHAEAADCACFGNCESGVRQAIAAFPRMSHVPWRVRTDGESPQ